MILDSLLTEGDFINDSQINVFDFAPDQNVNFENNSSIEVRNIYN
jgi:hypothetical protein